jgi:hypothetical protein
LAKLKWSGLSRPETGDVARVAGHAVEDAGELRALLAGGRERAETSPHSAASRRCGEAEPALSCEGMPRNLTTFRRPVPQGRDLP